MRQLHQVWKHTSNWLSALLFVSQVATRDLCRMACVNQWLRSLAAAPELWRCQYAQLFGAPPAPEWNTATVRRMCRRSELKAAAWAEAAAVTSRVGFAGTSCLAMDSAGGSVRHVSSADASVQQLQWPRVQRRCLVGAGGL